MLGGCSSTPLPPWPAPGTKVAPPKTQAVAPPPAGAQAPADQAVATPVVPITTSTDTAPIESTAVAAHFSEPPVQYDTPGLRPGRRAFSTNAEVSQWLGDLVRAPQGGVNARLMDLGLSQGGAAIQALALSTGARGGTPSGQSNGRPTVLLVGQQHGDEPASGEALMVIARELAQGLLEPMLQRINVVIVVRANPDGAANDAHATANGTDLDRDHLDLRTPEAQALARLISTVRPNVVADVHEYPVVAAHGTEGDWLPGQDVLAQYATTPNIPDFITKAAQEWYLRPMLEALDASQLTHEWFYRLESTDNGLSAVTGDARPQTLRNLGGLQNAVSLEIASRGSNLGAAHIQRRVHSLVVALSSVLRSTAERGKDLLQVQTFVARDIASRACQGSVAVQASPTTSQRELALMNAQTGAITPHKVNWTSTVQLQAEVSRPRPCGYWLAGDSAAAEPLRMLGLQVMRIAEAGSILTETFPANPAGAPAPQVLRQTVDAPAGSYYVGLNQSLANVAAAALEPGTGFGYPGTGRLAPGASARVINNPSLVFDDTE
ncbi:M14 family metallocarboxypeptidase [Comamonas sp. SCN 65-56]|nr:M14 family metallocarboxypeptidase [Comamonas sp. SCN 65-56]